MLGGSNNYLTEVEVEGIKVVCRIASTSGTVVRQCAVGPTLENE